MRVSLQLAFVLILAGCATSPETFVSNKDLGVYFTVPKSWFDVSQKALDQYEFDQIDNVQAQARYDAVLWQEAYSPTRLPARAVLASQAQDVPVAFVRVRTLTASEHNSISLNGLRDLVFPVTQLLATPSEETPLTLISDREVSQNGAAGVETTYDIVIGGESQRVRQISLVSTDRNRIYLFVLRCSTQCFTKNVDQIKEIAKSFTVRGTRG